MKKTIYLLIGVPVFAVTLAFSPLASAEEMTSSSGDTKRMEMRANVAKQRTELEQKLQAMKDERKTRLDETRKKVCETKSDKINQILQKRSTQATKQLEVFNKISDRVQAFITDKNLTVKNKDALLTAITEKQAAVQAAIDANAATTFNCDNTSADKPLQIPRTTMAAVRDALKEYRTAIKDLIVNVRSSATKTEAANAPVSTSGEVSQ
jgi:hypothetical protein